jgi:hypothetical protein
MRHALPALALAVLLATHVGAALGAAPTDPNAAGQQPLAIMRVGEAVDHIGPALAGGAGVAPNACFPALRTCWGSDQCYEYVQASAFNWAADRGVRVVSMSWLSGSPIENDLAAAIASHPNVLFVAIPSGNGGACDADAQPGDAAACADVNAQTPPMPCGLNVGNVLCVTTSAPDDGLACGAYGAQTVDVAVPTQNNVTTNRDGGFSPTNCATSYAAPTAAGLATILFGIDPAASAADVRGAIVDSARKVPAFQGKSVSGGIADAVAAVDLFQARRGIPGRTPQPPGPGPGPGDSTPTPGPSPGPLADTTAPVLTLSISPRRFRARRRGVKLRVGLTEAAKVTIRWTRVRAKRSAGSLTRSLPSGTARLAFAGKDRRGHKLRPGRYGAIARAEDAAGNASKPVSVGFTIARG